MSRDTKQDVNPALAAGLEPLAQEAEVRWSGPSLTGSGTFVPYLTGRLEPGAEAAATLPSHAADLHLACGCMIGFPEAVEIFEATPGIRAPLRFSPARSDAGIRRRSAS